MTFRTAAGVSVAIAAALSLGLYLASWFSLSFEPMRIWPLFVGTALVFASGIVSTQVMKPHYKVDRVLQIPRLKPYFQPHEYKSIWATFAFMMAAMLIGMLQISAGADATRTTFQIFAAGWFGFLYTDAMILLRAKFPSQPLSAPMSTRADG
jgi:hypothetical protein